MINEAILATFANGPEIAITDLNTGETEISKTYVMESTDDIKKFFAALGVDTDNLPADEDAV